MPVAERPWPLLLAGAAALSAGCASVGRSSSGLTTPANYVSYVPPAQALAWDGRTSTEGTLRLEGSAVSSVIDRSGTWRAGSGALRVPNVILEGAAMLAVTSNFELGARGTYAAYAWGEPNARGAAPMPDRPPVWGLGLEMRGMIGLDRSKHFTIGIGGNAVYYDLHYTEWRGLEEPTCPAGATCFVDASSAPTTYYRLGREQTSAHVVLNLAVYPSVGLGENNKLGHLFAGIAAHTSFGDVSSSSEAAREAPREASLIPIAGAGYGLKAGLMRFALMLSAPLTSASSDIQYGLSASFTFGLDIELWRPPEPGKERAR